MQVGRATGRVVAREQYERGEQVTRMKLLVVGRRDDALTSRGAGLQARQVADRLAVEAQHGIATGDSAELTTTRRQPSSRSAAAWSQVRR
mgnify:CR=1 FL=1